MADHWFISDHHLGHYNILRYGERPFANLAEMHDALVQRHNELVKPQDHVSFLGDLTLWRGGRTEREMFSKLIKQYNGHKRLYLGNHDHWPVDFYRLFFEKIYATWRCEEGFVASHIPLHPKSLSTVTANVHGHIHQAPTYEPVVFPRWVKDNGKVMPKRIVPYINVSVEAVGYMPVNKDDILAIIRRANGE